MVYFCLRNSTRHETAYDPSVVLTYKKKMELKRRLRIIWVLKKYKNINISIKFVCNPVDIHRTITHNRMQFNA